MGQSSAIAEDLPLSGEQPLEALVRREAGLRLRERDAEPLQRWAAERIGALRLGDASELAALLAEDSPSGRRERELLNARLTTGESYFFRDAGQFDLLFGTILPELIERRGGERRLRLWSAGCAAGEEAYSLAMLVEELAPRLAGWDVSILGTDINGAFLEKARRGAYGEWAFRALDAARRQRYFKQRASEWWIDARLRDRVTFRQSDLVRDRCPDRDAGLADIDLILCRNVFIYLEPEAVAAITRKFAAALAEGGYLLTAHSELFGHEVAPLRVRTHPQSAVYQKGAQAQASPALPKRHLRQDVLPQLPAAPMPRITPPPKPPAPPEPDAGALVESAWRHADRGRRGEAERDCRRAIALAGFDPRPYYVLAQLAQEGGDVDEAKALLKKVLYLDSSFVAAHLELAALYEQVGDRPRAQQARESACRVLESLPPQSAVFPYGGVTAGEVLGSVRRLLGKA
jgi:chemotaxis protein methyltransferase CheR